MAERSTFAGILDGAAKLAIAVVGLYATWFFNEAEKQRAEARMSADDEARLEETFARYYTQASSAEAEHAGAPAVTKNDELALAIATRAATQMRDRHGRTDLLDFLSARSSPQQSAIIRNVTLQTGEAAGGETSTDHEDQSASQTDGRGGWFAVAGSFSLNNRVLAEAFAADARTRLRSADVNLPVEVWETQRTRVFAVTIGGQLPDEAAAAQVATDLRQRGIAVDAFAQRNRDWRRSGNAVR